MKVVNTSVREELLNAFLEALAYKCALLSAVNPEDVTEQYGYVVRDGDYNVGLHALLCENNWAKKGEAGYNYVTQYYELYKAIDQHCNVYADLMATTD